MTTPNDNDDVQPAVAAALLALADLLETLPEPRWDTPSLCEGWRVREVVAHMTMAARYSPAEFGAELGAAQGDFTVLSNRVAARDGALPLGDLLGSLRSDVMQHWTPPGGGSAGALNHAVIHGLDITVPLGAERLSPDDTIRAVLDGLTRGGIHAHFGTDLTGIELRATDLDWSFGSGRLVTGAAQDIALDICGRTLPSGRLTVAGTVSGDERQGR